AAQPLREAADDLPLHQRRIDGAADVVARDVALDRDPAGLAIDPYHREVRAIGIDLVLGVEPAFRREPGLAAAARLRGRRKPARDLAQADRGAGAAVGSHDLAVVDRQR